MAIKTFKRYELKYILDRKQYDAVITGIAPYVETDAYASAAKHTVFSTSTTIRTTMRL